MSHYTYLKYNVMCLYNMSMYKVRPGANLWVKVAFYLWRLTCNLGLASGMILCAVDMTKKDSFDFPTVSVNIMNIVIFCCSLARINYYYVYEDQCAHIVETINAAFKRASETGLEEKTMDWHLKVSNVFVVCWSVAVFFTGEFMALLPLVLMDKGERQLPLPCWYPYDAKQSPLYEITYFTQALTQFYMGFSYGNSDMFYVCTVILTAGQFELLGWELKNVVYTALLKQGVSKSKVERFSQAFNKAATSEIWLASHCEGVRFGADVMDVDPDILEVIDSEGFRKQLDDTMAKCIEFHQTIKSVCSEIQTFMAPVLLPAIVLGVFYAIFILFALVTTKDNSLTWSLLEYLVMAYSEVFALTYFGQFLTTKTEELRENLFLSPWYLCDEKFKKTLNIVQIGLTDPVTLTAGKFFDMNLATFLGVMKTSFSYFTVLRQVTQK